MRARITGSSPSMARYLKLGGSDLLHEDEEHHHQQQQQHKVASSSPWPSLRRAHSSRERPREESPRRSVSLLGRAAQEQHTIPEQQVSTFEKLDQPRDEPRKKKHTSEVAGFLRRVKSSREQDHNIILTDVSKSIDNNNTNTNTINENSHSINNNNNNNSTTNTNTNTNANRPRNSFMFGFKKQVKQSPVVTGLPRAQSMRYNRIVSAESEEEGGGGFVPPRHSCVDVKLDKKVGEEVDQGGGEKRMVRISACYQTSEGEILSIECSQCGRWLGTVAQRVNLDTGSLKLCQICYPTQPEVKTAHAGGNNNTNTIPNANSLKKGSSFLRGLRKMLGLKKTSSR